MRQHHQKAGTNRQLNSARELRPMSRKTQLVVIGLTVLAIASAVSHLVTRTFKFRTEPVSALTFGATNLPVGATAAGSSLMFYGVDWGGVSKVLGTRVRGWAVPGGSVQEMEFLQRAAPAAGYTLVGVSTYDLNENYISEFHAEIAPLRETLSSLQAAHAGWRYAKRVLSQYPLKYLRVLFPSAGRSAHVMVGIREQLRSLRPQAAPEASERAVVSSESNSHQDSINAWPAARRLRNLGDMRGAAGSAFEFHGPKRESLFRFLRRGAAQGKMIVVVIPESPIYRQEFVTADVGRRFEALLAEARQRTPEAFWVRLDSVPELQSNNFYWDLVHLNAPGQALATRTLLARLEAAGILR